MSNNAVGNGHTAAHITFTFTFYSLCCSLRCRYTHSIVIHFIYIFFKTGFVIRKTILSCAGTAVCEMTI